MPEKAICALNEPGLRCLYWKKAFHRMTLVSGIDIANIKNVKCNRHPQGCVQALNEECACDATSGDGKY
jgi:hypothetical protein